MTLTPDRFTLRLQSPLPPSKRCVSWTRTLTQTIPDALHIPYGDVGIRIAELPPDTKIVVVTPNPNDSDAVVRFLRHRGLHDTWSLSGGLAAWKQAGGASDGSTP